MELGGTNALDSLASNGIIDFDADAFVRGTTPRYVGDPDGPTYLPFERPLLAEPYLGGKHLSGQPKHDEYVSPHNKKSHLNWKQALAGVIVAGLLVLGGIKCKGLFTRIGKLFSKKKNAGTAPKEGFFARIKSKVKGFFEKNKSAVTTKIAKSEETAKKAKVSIGDKIKNMPKWAKITAGVSAGLLGLYGLFKMTSGRSSHPQIVQGVPTRTMALAQESEQAAQQANVAQPNEITPATEVQPQSVLSAVDNSGGLNQNDPQQIAMEDSKPVAYVNPQQLATTEPQMPQAQVIYQQTPPEQAQAPVQQIAPAPIQYQQAPEQVAMNQPPYQQTAPIQPQQA